VSQGRKQRVLREPRGILLITPESLEALFVIHGPRLATVFADLRYIVIDELHAFISTERGRQVQSLLHRTEVLLQRRIPRVALSATLGDMGLAARFLRPKTADQVQIVISREGGQALKVQVRGYLTGPSDDRSTRKIAEDVFKVLRGHNNLIFCNSRQNVELYADHLRQLCESAQVPQEFFPHHGNLSKELREELESRLKDGQLPVSAVCTSTLELGIDIGSVASVAQIGQPYSVAALRQRLGRSGRRGDPSVLRGYLEEPRITEQSTPLDMLRLRLVQTIAIISLLIEKWYEPPHDTAFHLSTLIQQVLSVIAQNGGAKASQLFRLLCDAGPFMNVSQSMFAGLLRSMGQADLVQQCQDGTLLLGMRGESLVNHYEFYAAFTTPEEYRLATVEKTLGTIPVDFVLLPGMYVIFAGRRWEVLRVETEQRLILVKAAPGGRLPMFGGEPGQVHDRVRQRMRDVYRGTDRPAYLDPPAADLLAEGRATFQRFNLADRIALEYGADTLLFLWGGDRRLNTLATMLTQRGLRVSLAQGVVWVTGASLNETLTQLSQLTTMPPPDPTTLQARFRIRRPKSMTTTCQRICCPPTMPCERSTFLASLVCCSRPSRWPCPGDYNNYYVTAAFRTRYGGAEPERCA
jgi:ATP-dependent helicase Lhr and Lhr-like helicase